MIKDYFCDIDDGWSYKYVLAICSGCVLLFILWASVTTIEEHVRGFGRVITAGDIRVIQHLEGGIVSDIIVDEGQEVKKGDVLFHIKNQKAQSDLQELQVAMSSNIIKRIRLEAELNEMEEVAFPEELEKNYPEIADSERQLFGSRIDGLNHTIKALEKQIKQRVLKLDKLNSTVANLQKELDIISERFEIRSELRKTGAVSRSQYLDTLSKVRDFETRIEETRKEIPITKSEIAELTNNIEEKRQNYRAAIGEELNEVKVEIRKIQQRIDALTDLVNRTAIRSPVSGVVNKIHVNTIGGVIQPGGRIADIIPTNENLVVEGRISTNDRGKVWLNLPVVAKITAYDYTLYGGIDGTLTYISADSFIDKQNQEYYEIRASLEESGFGGDKAIHPGMTVELSILTGEMSILNAVLKPFWNIRNNALREK